MEWTSNSDKTTPNEKISAYLLPSITSGAIQRDVPMPAVMVWSCRSRETPKSVNFAPMDRFNRIFARLQVAMQDWRRERMEIRESMAHLESYSGLLLVKATLVVCGLVCVQKTAQIPTTHKLEQNAEVGKRVPRNANKFNDLGMIQYSRNLGFGEEIVHVLEAGACGR
ncbi:unnamed protein product [Phytophthora fragariaefolia]|uniref:Unnamed protein product n=1 Tax=Phytophthora fragariaefolia TaxID=1490495 RepID=A0A9W6WYE2_9STRA|nr:unnamed protein product [Phytophthora fragariaefolia]